MQITLELYITPIIRYLLSIKMFHNHMLFAVYFDKRNNSLKQAARKFLILISAHWIGVLPVYPKFCIVVDDSY